MSLKRSVFSGLIVGVFVLGLGVGFGQDLRMTPGRDLIPVGSSVSSENILGIERNGPGILPLFTKPAGLEPDTVRLLAIRVQFQTDTDEKTTGDGTFDFSTGSVADIDPPPHNSVYFERHLRSLRNYYQSVSHGKLVIDYTLCGCGSTSDHVFTLAHPMSFYTTGSSGEKDRLLAVFLQDVIQLVDAACDVQFSAYDSYLIFHAGTGSESDLRNNSKNDIPSAFYSFADLKMYLGENDPGYDGIPVKDGFVREGWWLPETESQDGFEFGLNGMAAHLFGYQLGLPSLYNTQTGRSVIGRWGLMDQGFDNESGTIPAQPCLWSKAFLGWVTPHTVHGAEDLEIAAWALESGLVEAVKVDITLSEYFLIENRQQDINSDNTMIRTVEEGVVVAVDEYDWGIPGSGLLIWHIDEAVIAGGYESNQVNINSNHRGVDLMEADGVKEIGTDYGYIYGQRDDAFYAGNPAWAEANPFLDSIRFTYDSNPNSRSYSGANSHISVTNISALASTMACRVAVDTYQQGWPQYVGGPMGTNSPVYGDVENNGDLEIVAASEAGLVFVWNADGSKFIPNMDALPGVDARGDTAWIQAAVFADVGDSIFWSPSLQDLDGDGDLEIIVSSSTGELYAWHHTDIDPVDGRGDLVDGYPVSGDGAVPPVAGDLNRDGLKESILVNGEQSLNVVNNLEQPLDGWPVQVSGRLGGSPALGDIDDDGYLEILIGGENRVYAFNYNGSAVPGWPVTVDRTDPVAVFRSSPVIGDIDGDGDLEMLIGSPGGQVAGYDHTGTGTDGFPLACGGEVNATPAILDADGDGDVEVVAGCDDGYVYMWDLDGTYNENTIPWPMYGHDEQHTNDFPPDDLPPDVPAEELMAETSVYNFPNPTEGTSTRIRYRLGEEASVTIRIFNVAGELIDEFAGPGHPHTENEITWDLTDIASGVYLCRVEASGAGGTTTAFCKIAVAK